MRNRILALLATAALIPGSVACADLTEADLEVFLEELAAAYPIPDLGKPLSESSDKDVQAAGASYEAIQKDREAQRLLNEALESKEPALVSEALTLRPWDVDLRFHQAAFMIAFDNRAEALRSLREIMDLVGFGDDRTDFSPLASARFEFHWARRFLDALSRTMEAFEESSPEWARLNAAYCQLIPKYKAMVQAVTQELDIHPDPDRYPIASCP